MNHLENDALNDGEIRQAKIEDADIVVSMYFAAIADMRARGIEQWDEHYPNREDLRKDIQNGQMHLLMVEGTLAAAIVLNEQQDVQYEGVEWKYRGMKALVMHRLCVRPELQGKGLGRRMALFAEAFGRANGYGVIRLDAFVYHPSAPKLYRSLGYELAGIATFRKGDFCCFEKRLQKENDSIEENVDEIYPNGEDFVDLHEVLPDALIDLRYATADNFTEKVIYDFTQALLRRRTAGKLKTAARVLRGKGLRLVIWDAFRPKYAQEALWQKYPVPGFVANPYEGGSNHTRGTAVDITLANPEGQPLPMPTGFDVFTSLADRDYSDVTDEEARKNAELLERVMLASGFDAHFKEWWHFADTQSSPLYEEGMPKVEGSV